MKVIQASSNVESMLQMYETVQNGYHMVARGSACRNVQNLAIVFNANEPVITSFDARQFNLPYAKREWLWYLGADKFDSSIEQYATMWKKLKQPDGSYFSNYGQYIFGKNDPPESAETSQSQFEYVIDCLLRDPQSRRASIVLLDKDHLFLDNVDTVCTYSINFTLQDGRLDMTVMMRSNDVIFGFTNDAFCFWNLYQFVYSILRQRMGPYIKQGFYTHITNSMHVYERHFIMIDQIINGGKPGYSFIDVPRPTATASEMLVASKGKNGHGKYYDWLTAV